MLEWGKGRHGRNRTLEPDRSEFKSHLIYSLQCDLDTVPKLSLLRHGFSVSLQGSQGLCEMGSGVPFAGCPAQSCRSRSHDLLSH